VPVFTSHSESVWVETRDRIKLDAVKKALASGEGLILKDDFRNFVYPTALDSSGRDSEFVGRVREDISTENGITMWVVGDQLRKGAALNAIQIAEELIGRE
ncbi:MAG: Asd/ArgC dimerization domain-containing protein, partial [Actinomycetota bacterium]|nr:Asd/ArgC dimerization domain-containing protein [Actinomycetota bacterium]